MTGRFLGELPRPQRWALIGAGCAAGIGGFVGLIIGLMTYPRTAWFAVIELGYPCAIVGGTVGLALGALSAARHRPRH